MTGEIAAYITRNGSTMTKLQELDPAADDSRIYYPRLEEQGSYPAIEFNDFGDGIDCKDGLHGRLYTTTAIVWAKTMSQINDITEALIEDLHHYRGTYSSTYKIVTSKMTLIGPIIDEPEKKIIGRPIDFEMQLEKI